MNPDLLQDFCRQVQSIRDCWDNIQTTNQLLDSLIGLTGSDDLPVRTRELSKKAQEQYKKSGFSKRIFDYKASIISMYGILESSIELWIKEYIRTICQFYDSYGELPLKLRENHFENSLRLIQRISQTEEAKYQHLTKENVLANLAQCIDVTNISSYVQKC